MAYVPRLIAPANDNPLYYSNYNTYYAAGWGMPNCTAYAYGRCAEIMGCYPMQPPVDPNQNAEDWYNYNDGLPRGSDRKSVV